MAKKCTHCIGSSWGLMRDHTTDGSPEDTAGESVVKWTMLVVIELSLSHKVFEFNFVFKVSKVL